MYSPDLLPMAVAKIATREFTGKMDAGWYAVNSVVPGDCRPSYRSAGGGVSESNLTDLPEAIDKCINHVEARIADAQRHLADLRAARAAFPQPGSPDAKA
jgi:hypothetical protein